MNQLTVLIKECKEKEERGAKKKLRNTLYNQHPVREEKHTKA